MSKSPTIHWVSGVISTGIMLSPLTVGSITRLPSARARLNSGRTSTSSQSG